MKAINNTTKSIYSEIEFCHLSNCVNFIVNGITESIWIGIDDFKAHVTFIK